jgi:hypothetical protein
MGRMGAGEFNREVEEVEEVLRRVQNGRRLFVAFVAFDDKLKESANYAN